MTAPRPRHVLNAWSADFKRLFTLSEYYDRDRSQFYLAIQGVRERGMDLTGWLEFFVDGLATQLRGVKARGDALAAAAEPDLLTYCSSLTCQAMSPRPKIKTSSMFTTTAPGSKRRQPLAS